MKYLVMFMALRPKQRGSVWKKCVRRPRVM
jgi:hypothetical protein